MSTRTETPTARPAVDGVRGARILVVESRYYPEIADALISGAEREIKKNGAALERVVVPGAFEIPGAIALAAGCYDGFIALGCVIRSDRASQRGCRVGRLGLLRWFFAVNPAVACAQRPWYSGPVDLGAREDDIFTLQTNRFWRFPR